MGRVISGLVSARKDCEIVAGVDLDNTMYAHYPVFKNFNDVKCEADVIIDFSHPSVLTGMLTFAKKRKLAAVIATTGLSSDQVEEIKRCAAEIAVFFTFNMSLGINLLLELSRKAAAVLADDFDIEIIERHHNQKLDAPSGTAIMLANEMNDELDGRYIYEYDRHSKRQKRTKKEIGMHAVRGGTIVGEHEVLFAGRDEIISLTHSATSKDVFAVGALNAALFVAPLKPGLYSMKELVASK